MIRSFRKKADALSGMLQQQATRKLLEDYVEWVIARQSTNKALGPLPRVADLLERIERRLPAGGPVLPTTIREALTTEEIRLAGLFAMFLSECGLILGSSRERAAASDTRRIEAALAEVSGKPWEKAIREYVTELAAPERNLAERSRRLYLRAAVALMAFSGVEAIRELTDEHIRKFLRSKPGHRASIFPWLSFVRERINRRLTVPKRVARTEATVGSVAGDVGHLVTAVRNAPTKKAGRALLAKLLSILYDVPLEHVVAMELADIDVTSEATRLRFGYDWVTVEAPIDELLFGLIDGDDNKSTSAKLFPGRLEVDGLSVGTVQYHSKHSNAQ
jgi:hypothetical protein